MLGIEYILPCSPGFYYSSISVLKSSCLLPLSREMTSKYLIFDHKAKSLSKRLPVFICISTLLIMDWHTIKLPRTPNKHICLWYF